MATILVTSSPNRDSHDFNKSHPGTIKDDVFIISESSHGFPSVNGDKNSQGGNDIYRLSLDVKPNKKEPHPYGEGGGTPSINGFTTSRDQIILPKGVALEDIVINNYDHQPNSIYQRAEIRYDPHKTLEKIYDPLGNLGRFSGGFLRGKTLVFTASHTSKKLTGNDYSVTRKEDPTGYQQWQIDINERAQRLGQKAIVYAADDIGDISFTGSLDEFFHSIKDSKGESLYDYALNRSSESTKEKTSEQLSKAVTRPSKFTKKSADKITNFNPSTDTLEINTDSFGIDTVATFAAGKNSRAIKKLAKKDFDFIYDQKKGGLYFNENGPGKGFGDGGIIAILKGAPDLTSSNLEFIGETIYAPNKFNKKVADQITNFNSSTNTLDIDTDSFGIDSSATFAAGKNSRVINKLAKKDFDFLYDQKKGGLYFNENGPAKGFGDGGIIAILKGAPDLTAKNLELI